MFGSFDDISAYSFYSVQKDLDYRKKWDKLVIKLDVVDVESTKPKTVSKRHRLYDTGNELIHWIMKYPVSFFLFCVFCFSVIIFFYSI